MRATTLCLSIASIGLLAAGAGEANASTVNFGLFGASSSSSGGRSQGQASQSKVKKNTSPAATSTSKGAAAISTGKQTTTQSKSRKTSSPTLLAASGNPLTSRLGARSSRGSGSSGNSGSSGSAESLVLLSASAEPSWVELSTTNSPLSISYVQGQDTLNATVNYSPSPASEIWYLDGTVDGGQSAENILAMIAAQFTVNPTTLTYVSGCDSPTSGCTQATGGTATGLYSNTFTSDLAFTYLAVHYGGGELLFHWDDAINFFEIGGLPNGLSNYRAYTDVVTAVPLPASLPLMLSGLGVLGFIGLRRRKLSA